MAAEKRYKLKVTDPGTLLSTVIDIEISDLQLEAVQIVIDDEKMAFNVVEDKRITGLLKKQHPEWFDFISESEARALDGNR